MKKKIPTAFAQKMNSRNTIIDKIIPPKKIALKKRGPQAKDSKVIRVVACGDN
jgi:hypothetical protein